MLYFNNLGHQITSFFLSANLLPAFSLVTWFGLYAWVDLHDFIS